MVSGSQAFSRTSAGPSHWSNLSHPFSYTVALSRASSSSAEALKDTCVATENTSVHVYIYIMYVLLVHRQTNF